MSACIVKDIGLRWTRPLAYSCQCEHSTTTAAANCHCSHCLFCLPCKTAAPCEARSHDLQIMRLTRCLLRQRGYTYPHLCKQTWVITTLLHQLHGGYLFHGIRPNANVKWPGQLWSQPSCSTRGISSNGRALALHVRSTGIDTRILQMIAFLFFFSIIFLANWFRSNSISRQILLPNLGD